MGHNVTRWMILERLTNFSWLLKAKNIFERHAIKNLIESAKKY